MNILGTFLSRLFNQKTVDRQASADIRQGQLKVLADRLRQQSVLTPKVLTGGAMLAGLWWITKRREKVKEAQQDTPR